LPGAAALATIQRRGPAVETARLRLRPPRLSDVPMLFEFLGDPAAMRFTHCDQTLRQCRRRIAAHERRRQRDGCAPWAVLTKTDGRIIGWGGLYEDPFDPGWGVELGYSFHPAVWGNGYASELVAVCLGIADRVFRFKELKAFARPENRASRRVLEKSGFAVDRFIPQMGRLLYRRLADTTAR
jgi:[ribosomal protein S5]-alanine N-acetyltransferase